MGLCGGLMTIPLTALFTWLIEVYKSKREYNLEKYKLEKERRNREEELLLQHKYSVLLETVKSNLDNDRRDSQLDLVINRLDRIEQSLKENDNFFRDAKDSQLLSMMNLEETIAGRKLLDLLQSPYGDENEFEKANNFRGTTVALWGSRSAGKTCLILSLAKSIYKYNSRNVSFGLRHENGEPFNPYSGGLSSLPTPDASVASYVLERRFKKDIPGAKTSSFKHKLLVHDDQGDVLMGKVLRHVDDSMSVNRASAAFSILNGCDGIIVTLNTGVDDVSQFTIAFEKLIESISRRQAPLSGLALCVTKADQLTIESHSVQNFDPEYLMIRHFGKEETQKIIKLADRVHPTKLFVTSAVGFVHGRTNFNPATNDLASLEEWEPYGVEFPFFWILSNVEKGILQPKKKDLEKYIPYPLA